MNELWLIACRENPLRELVNEIHTRTKIFPCDLLNDEHTQKIFDALELKKPCVKFFINAESFEKIGGANDIELDDFRKMIDLNCKAAVTLIQKIIPFMGESYPANLLLLRISADTLSARRRNLFC